MHAFIEWLPEDARIGIIRVGPEAREYGRDYDFAVVLVARNGVAEICALTKSATELRRAHVEAAITIVRRECNVLPRWERIKGDRTMARHPHPDEARNPDGTYDLAKAEAGIQHYIDLIKSGELSIEHLGQTTTKSGRVHFTFEGQLKNP